MIVGAVVRQTIQLRRAYDCSHAWVKDSPTEDRCTECGVIATEEGKKNLARMAARFHGRPSPV